MQLELVVLIDISAVEKVVILLGLAFACVIRLENSDVFVNMLYEAHLETAFFCSVDE